MPQGLVNFFTSWWHVHPIRPRASCSASCKEFSSLSWHSANKPWLSLSQERSKKSKKPYCLPLSATFDRVVLKGKLPETFVFLNSTGRLYAASGLPKIWHKAARCLTSISTIVLGIQSHPRLNAGVSQDRISAGLGHSNLEITHRYASLNVQKLSDVVDGFG